jgi:hypothetical protein
MADKSCVKGTDWRLRSTGNPTLVCADNTENCECAPGNRSRFVLQSFGLEIRNTKTYFVTKKLPSSTDFIGLNPDGNLESANFQAQIYTTLDGELLWAGQEVETPQYVDEDQMPGINDLFD